RLRGRAVSALAVRAPRRSTGDHRPMASLRTESPDVLRDVSARRRIRPILEREPGSGDHGAHTVGNGHEFRRSRIVPRHSDANVGVGVIGCGYWGPNHVRNFGRQEHAHVVGVCDSRYERAAKLAAEYRLEFATDRASDLIRHPDVDLIVVATPSI